MIPVSFHKVGEVALMPFVKEACVVVLCFLSAPHIKALVKYHKAHRVAHVQKFRCRGVVSAAQTVDTHLLKA